MAGVGAKTRRQNIQIRSDQEIRLIRDIENNFSKKTGCSSVIYFVFTFVVGGISVMRVMIPFELVLSKAFRPTSSKREHSIQLTRRQDG